ncbi:MAG: hypothetical protein SFU53_10585 [Terrimicrobiaceae bacterium]|nr:hypothetical protein [Terrimicrobiaceae bacterium]
MSARALLIPLLGTLIASAAVPAAPPPLSPTPDNFPASEYVAGTRYAILPDAYHFSLSGDLGVTFQKSGVFSAQLRLGKTVKRFSGRTNANADWPADASIGSMMVDGTPLDVTFGWVGDGKNQWYHCTVACPTGLFNSSGAIKALLPANSDFARQSNGKFTMLVGPGSAPFPLRHGFATVNVSKGVVTGAGFSADGCPLTFSAPILEDGTWAFFRSADPVTASFVATAEFQSCDAFEGEFEWELPSASNSQDAPPKQIQAIAGARRSTDPQDGFPAVAGPWLAHVAVGSSDLANAVAFTLPIGKGPQKVVPEYDGVTKASFSLNKVTGLFSGSFAVEGRTQSYRGVVYDPENLGVGLVTNGPLREVDLIPMEFPAPDGSASLGGSGTLTIGGGGGFYMVGSATLTMGGIDAITIGSNLAGGVLAFDTVNLGFLPGGTNIVVVDGTGTLTTWNLGALPPGTRVVEPFGTTEPTP